MPTRETAVPARPAAGGPSRRALRTLLPLIAVAWAALPTPGRAAATLDDCFREALKRSETLAQSKEAIFQAEELYHQALGAILPSVTLNESYLRQDDHAYNAILNEFNPANQNQLDVTVDQPLFRGFAEYAALREVKDQLVSSKDAHRWAAMQIYQDVAQAFYQVLSLERSRALIADQISQYDAKLKEERTFYAIGRARDSDLATVRAAQSLLNATGAQVDEQVAVEREVLAFLTGRQPDEALAPESADDLAVPESRFGTRNAAGTLDALLKGLDHRPDLHAALMQDAAAHELVKVSKGAHLPSVDFIGHWYPEPRAGISSVINWDATINASLPLFEGFTLVSKDRQAESVARQSDLNVELQRRQAASQVRTAWNTLRGDLGQATALDRAYKLSNQAYLDLEHDYREGLDTDQDVLTAMTAAWAAKQSLEAMRYTARNDYEQLETMAGRRLYLVP